MIVRDRGKNAVLQCMGKLLLNTMRISSEIKRSKQVCAALGDAIWGLTEMFERVKGIKEKSSSCGKKEKHGANEILKRARVALGFNETKLGLSIHDVIRGRNSLFRIAPMQLDQGWPLSKKRHVKVLKNKKI